VVEYALSGIAHHDRHYAFYRTEIVAAAAQTAVREKALGATEGYMHDIAVRLGSNAAIPCLGVAMLVVDNSTRFPRRRRITENAGRDIEPNTRQLREARAQVVEAAAVSRQTPYGTSSICSDKRMKLSCGRTSDSVLASRGAAEGARVRRSPAYGRGT